MRIVKTIIMMTLILLAGVVLYEFGYTNNSETIEYFKGFIHNGEIVDYDNELGISDISKDVKYMYEKDNSVIVFELGNVKLKYRMEDFIKKETQEELASIGFKITQNKKTLKFNIEFRGVEIKEYVYN